MVECGPAEFNAKQQTTATAGPVREGNTETGLNRLGQQATRLLGCTHSSPGAYQVCFTLLPHLGATVRFQTWSPSIADVLLHPYGKRWDSLYGRSEHTEMHWAGFEPATVPERLRVAIIGLITKAKLLRA